MRTRTLYGTITAMMIAGTLTVGAQTPQTPQTTQPTPRPAGDQRSDSAQRSGSEQTVTVSGCLQQNTAMGTSGAGSAGATGSAGSTGSATGAGTGSTAGSAGASGSSQGRPGNFVLANAKMAQGSSTSGLGTATRISLTGMSDAELSKHVNHHIEVTGRLSSMGGTSSGNRSGSATGTTGATGSTGSATGSTGSTGSTGASSTGTTGSTGAGSTGSGSTGSTGSTARTGGSMGSGAGTDMPQLHATNIKMIAATCPAQQ